MGTQPQSFIMNRVSAKHECALLSKTEMTTTLSVIQELEHNRARN
jgi:hypothetical protein